jgi:P27 family predicted phage terminase small subunit
MNKKNIVEYIKGKGIYDDVDIMMVDELIFNMEMVKTCKKNIKEYGVTMNISKDPQKPYFQVSPNVTTYNSCIKNIMNLSRKLALSPLDRQNLKISNVVDDEGYED